MKREIWEEKVVTKTLLPLSPVVYYRDNQTCPGATPEAKRGHVRAVAAPAWPGPRGYRCPRLTAGTALPVSPGSSAELGGFPGGEGQGAGGPHGARPMAPRSGGPTPGRWRAVRPSPPRAEAPRSLRPPAPCSPRWPRGWRSHRPSGARRALRRWSGCRRCPCPLGKRAGPGPAWRPRALGNGESRATPGTRLPPRPGRWQLCPAVCGGFGNFWCQCLHQLPSGAVVSGAAELSGGDGLGCGHLSPCQTPCLGPTGRWQHPRAPQAQLLPAGAPARVTAESNAGQLSCGCWPLTAHC